jgi:hypothetical protein
MFVREVSEMTHSLTLEIPEEIYQPIAEEAKAEGRKVEEIALERLAKGNSKQEKDPLDEFVGIIRSDIPDWADNHDKYLGEELAKDLNSK